MIMFPKSLFHLTYEMKVFFDLYTRAMNTKHPAKRSVFRSALK